MSVESRLEEWQAQLKIQTQRKEQELAKARTHQANAADAEQQILLLTGGITFARNIESEDNDQTDKEEEE